MKSIRGGRGLGDSIYVQSVCRHLIERGSEPLRVCSDWPDVFLPLGEKVKVVPFTRNKIDILAHYSTRKGEKTTQFHDCCISAGIDGLVDLRLDWPTTPGPLVNQVRAPGKPVICVQLPRTPMGRTDGFGKELLPDCNVIQRFIDRLAGLATIVQIGAGQALYKFTGIDIDLANKTTVRELIDVASVADGFIGYCSFVLPLAESLKKPSIMVWARAGLKANHMYIRRITPEKIIEYARTQYVIDDCGDYEIDKALDGFRYTK